MNLYDYKKNYLYLSYKKSSKKVNVSKVLKSSNFKNYKNKNFIFVLISILWICMITMQKELSLKANWRIMYNQNHSSKIDYRLFLDVYHHLN
jgi:hypothetical protein